MDASLLKFDFAKISGAFSSHRKKRNVPNNTVVSSSGPVFKLLKRDVPVVRPYCLRSLHRDQRVNHFPRSAELCRKDRLAANVARMQALHGKEEFDFLPDSFLLPQELRRLSQAMSGEEQFIVKPIGSSRGRGIFLATKVSEIPPTSDPLLASRYISNPLLLNGHKFDLRLYVAVTSFQPLVAYLYQEGLVRLSSELYESGSYDRSLVHLTNYSLQRHSEKYVRDDSLADEGRGHKWSLGAFLRHLRRQRNLPPELLMLRLEDVVVKALLSAQARIGAATYAYVPFLGNCFELFGFDILVDESLKPWLLEVQLSPSLTCDTELDYRVKASMLADLLTLVGLPQGTAKPLKVTRPSTFGSELSPEPPKSGRTFRPRTASHKAARNARAHMLKRQMANRAAPHRVRGFDAQQLQEAVLHRVCEEESRAGGFQRLLPSAAGLTLYGPMFEPHLVEKEEVAVDAFLAHRLYPESVTVNRHTVLTELSDPAKRAFSDLSSEVQGLFPEAGKRCRAYEARLPSLSPGEWWSFSDLSCEVQGLFPEAGKRCRAYEARLPSLSPGEWWSFSDLSCEVQGLFPEAGKRCRAYEARLPSLSPGEWWSFSDLSCEVQGLFPEAGKRCRAYEARLPSLSPGEWWSFSDLSCEVQGLFPEAGKRCRAYEARLPSLSPGEWWSFSDLSSEVQGLFPEAGKRCRAYEARLPSLSPGEWWSFSDLSSEVQGLFPEAGKRCRAYEARLPSLSPGEWWSFSDLSSEVQGLFPEAGKRCRAYEARLPSLSPGEWWSFSDLSSEVQGLFPEAGKRCRAYEARLPSLSPGEWWSFSDLSSEVQGLFPEAGKRCRAYEARLPSLSPGEWWSFSDLSSEVQGLFPEAGKRCRAYEARLPSLSPGEWWSFSDLSSEVQGLFPEAGKRCRAYEARLPSLSPGEWWSFSDLSSEVQGLFPEAGKRCRAYEARLPSLSPELEQRRCLAEKNSTRHLSSKTKSNEASLKENCH